MKHIINRIVFGIFVFCFFQHGLSQTKKDTIQTPKSIEEISDALINKLRSKSKGRRPKIGLTFSGGGAKGMAHIGVLKAIDSAGLKIDYVTGTSMGAVVGGLYAVGYSGNAIENIAHKIDWDLLFSTSPKLSSISIEEKDEFNKYALEIPFERGRFKIGKGIIEGQELWLKFAELFQPVYNVTDFSKFSIPFKCIGTDLSTGNAVVMDRGNIVTAIRGSMAIPSIFTPVQYEGKIVADGGMVNNFPVLDVKEMGADIVIGVNLNSGLTKAEELESIFDVLLQLAFFKDATTFEKHKEQCDVYIFPDLEEHSTGSFSETNSIIEIGNKYGKMYYPLFKRLADTLNSLYPDENTFKADRLPITKTIQISKYSVEGLNKTTEKFFFGISGLKAGKPFSFEKEAEAIRKIYGSRYYKKINFDFINDGSEGTEMHFKVEEYPLSAIKFGINYNNYTKLNLICNATSRDLILKESRATATFSISENPRIFLEYYKYIGRSRKMGFNMAFYNENVDFPIYKDFSLLETIRSHYSFGDIRTQYNISKDMYVGLSQQYNSSVIKTPNINVVDFEGKNHFWHTYVSYRLNTVDKKYFTTNGWKIKADLGYIYNQNGSISLKNDSGTIDADSTRVTYNNTIRLHFKEEEFKPLSSKLVFFRNTSLALLFNKNPYLPNSFQIGGISDNVVNQVHFAGLNESQIKTGSILSEQAGLQMKLTSSAYLTARVNLALYNFYGTNFNMLALDKNVLSGSSLTVGMMTPIGPIEISAMYSNQSKKVVPNLNLGYRF